MNMIKDKERTTEENVALMDFMMSTVKSMNQMIAFCDFDVYLDSIDEAEVMMPLFDPTAYMKTDHKAVAQTVKLVKMYKSIQDYLKSLTTGHKK